MGNAQHVDWTLLRDNRLDAYDRFDLRDNCRPSSDYGPAVGDRIETERKLVAYKNRLFPNARAFEMDMYWRGILLAKVGRVDDAEALLEAGPTRSIAR